MGEEALPEVIGPYRIRSKLGQGGMGAVYMGVHEMLERPAAVKILPPEFAQNTQYVQRFLREARLVATLRHANIVQVYDAGAYQGRYFIAMELVDGQSLAAYLHEKGRLDEPEGVELMYQAAKGLAAAHIKGLVHRDIKPENMLLDGEHTIRIVDFGLVMEQTSDTQLTAAGSCLGTPMYMSPEQADGIRADGRSDLYSLGVTFYRALTGSPPFSSTSVMTLLFKHKFEAPPHPRKLRPELTENVCNLLLTMMAKRREDRPPSAEALIRLIEDMRAGKAIPPPPAPQAQPSPPVDPFDKTLVGPTPDLLTAEAQRAQRTAQTGSGPSTTPGPVGAVQSSPAADLLTAEAQRTQRTAQTGSGPSTTPGPAVAVQSSIANRQSSIPPSPGPAVAVQSSIVNRQSSTPPSLGPAVAVQSSIVNRQSSIAQSPAPSPQPPPASRSRGAILIGAAVAALLIAAGVGYALLRGGGKPTQTTEGKTGPGGETKGGTKTEAAKDTDPKSAEQQELLSSARKMEQNGDYVLALALYEKAAQLLPTPELQAKIQELKLRTEAVEKAKPPPQKAVDPAEPLLAQAQQEEARGDYDRASVSYEAAAKMTTDPARAAECRQKANACRKLMYVQCGLVAEAARDWDSAAIAYTQALALGKDATLEAKRDEILAKAKAETEFRGYVAAGDQALAAEQYAQARASYRLALKLKPGDAATQAKIDDADRREQQAKAAAAAADIAPRLAQQVQSGQTAAALQALTQALAGRPQDQTLLQLKAGLENVQACESVCKGLEPVLSQGQTALNDALAIQHDDAWAEAVRDSLEQKARICRDLEGQARARFAGRLYDQLPAAVTEARSLAAKTATEMATGRTRYEQKAKDAADFKGLDVGIFRLGSRGDKQKAEKYTRIAGALEKLEQQARALGQ